MVVVLGLGAYIAFGYKAPPAAPVQTAAAPQASTSTSTSTAPATPQTEPDASAAPAPQAPTFDEVRREGDGTTIIAGRAAPMSDVKILVDGQEVATAKSDTSGGFAAIAVVPPAASAQVVSLSARGAAEEMVSLDQIILAPSSSLPLQPDAAATPPTIETATAVPEQLPEPAAVSVLKSDADGVSLIRPQVMTSVALDTIGYSDLGDVQLTGRAQADTASVRIYLDNRAVVSLPVDDDGRWRGDLPDVDEGVYTLRVDEMTAAGTVSSRVETPFKRESAETLAQAATTGDGPVKSVTVQTGATLWAIARDRYGDGTLYVRVFEANADSIRDPDLIYPGQVFDLPN